MTPKQQMMVDYLDGKMTNVEIIDAWDRQRKQNERYRYALRESLIILKEAIQAIDNNEKLNGLEYGLKAINEALEDDEQ